MAKYVFYTTMTEYGTIEVEADSLSKAEKMAWEMDGKYTPHQNIVEDIEQKLTF